MSLLVHCIHSFFCTILIVNVNTYHAVLDKEGCQHHCAPSAFVSNCCCVQVQVTETEVLQVPEAETGMRQTANSVVSLHQQRDVTLPAVSTSAPADTQAGISLTDALRSWRQTSLESNLYWLQVIYEYQRPYIDGRL